VAIEARTIVELLGEIHRRDRSLSRTTEEKNHYTSNRNHS